MKKAERPFSNDVTCGAIQSEVLGDPTGRTANAERFANVTADFWT